MKLTYKLLTPPLLAACMVCANGQALFSGESQLLHNTQNVGSANVSVFPGDAIWDTITGPANFGTFGDGTVLDYAFYNADNITADVVAPFAAGSATFIGDATAPAANRVGGGRTWVSVWVNNIDNGGGDWSTTADFPNMTTNTGIKSANISGSIDVSTLTTGSIDFIYGSFVDEIEITAVMTGDGQPDINASGGVYGTSFFGNNAGSVVTTLYFDTNMGDYDTITWTQTNADTDGSRASFTGLVLDEGPIPDPDSDGDGLFDDYEDANGLDKFDDGTFEETAPGLKDGPYGALGDPDFDGLTNLQEHNGLDGSGVSHGYGQTLAGSGDSDMDGLFDDEEITGSQNSDFSNEPTNPNSPDSDSDGLNDEAEVFGDLNEENNFEATNPNLDDTDFDGMKDKFEIESILGVGLGGLDPNVDDSAGNLDGDSLGLSNLDEHDGTTMGVPTNPAQLDTDSDGFEDIHEDRFKVGFENTAYISPTSTGTDPTNPDQDGDGLLDGDEQPDLVGGYPGPGVTPTNSDPHVADGDSDGVPDGFEVHNHSTNPGLADSDADTFDDPSEIFVYGTDPNLIGDVPSAAQLAELRVNFQPGDPSTLPVPSGFQSYEAVHEVPGTWDDTSYSAFGTSITVGLSWGNGVDPVGGGTEQMFDRANRLPEWAHFQRGWAGTDNRPSNSQPLEVTVSGLPAGDYLWTSHHVDMNDREEPFNASITSASGTSDVTNINPDPGVIDFQDIATYQQVFTSDGNPVTVTFENGGTFFYMNGFQITNTNLPVTGDLRITGVNLEVGTGDLLIDFLPGGTGYILTSSDDLFSDFVEETNAVLENSDSTFRVPAANLNQGQGFFRVEDAP